MKQMNALSPEEAKRAIRRLCREKAAEMTPDKRAESDRKILEHLLSMPEYKDAGTVFVYVSVEAEPDTHALIRLALCAGKRVTVPLCSDDGNLEARRIGSMNDLVPSSKFKIPEPAPWCPPVPRAEIDLAVMPGISFGPDGARLGHGGGWYDRFLNGFCGFSAGLCRRACYMRDIPMCAHDRPVDAVVTEDGVIRHVPKCP